MYLKVFAVVVVILLSGIGCIGKDSSKSVSYLDEKFRCESLYKDAESKWNIDPDWKSNPEASTAYVQTIFYSKILDTCLLINFETWKIDPEKPLFILRVVDVLEKRDVQVVTLKDYSERETKFIELLDFYR